MKFKQFQNQLSRDLLGTEVSRRVSAYNHNITETVDGRIFIDRRITEYSSLEEAANQVRQAQLQEDIQREIQQELYEEMSDNKVADIIRKHHGNIRVTDTLIESYVKLASSKIFTADPVGYDIRRSQNLDRLVEGHLDFTLDDGSVIVISESVQSKLNNTFGSHADVIEYMRTSKENFLSVINQLED